MGVTEAFNEVVARNIDMPSLWNKNKHKSLGRSATADTTAVGGPRRDTAKSKLTIRTQFLLASDLRGGRVARYSGACLLRTVTRSTVGIR